MKNDDFDKRLSAYIDGALPDARRARLERELETDAGLAKQLRRSRALAGLVREAWTEGPAAPTPEVLLAAIRPELAAIARERRAQPAWRQSLEQARIRFASWWSPVPLATSAIAAFLLAVAFLPQPDASIQNLGAFLPALESASNAPSLPARTSSTPAWQPRQRLSPSLFAPASTAPDYSSNGVYDVSPGENPALLFQNEDGSTVLWLLDEDDLSLMLERMDRWG